MTNKRNIIVILTIALFFVTAPLVTLYTAGFRYHWKKHLLERVGFFETSTIPSGASVLMDGALVGTTPYVDRGIFPGNHTLEISKTGYRTVTREFDVKSGIATLLLNQILWKNGDPVFMAEAFANAELSPNGTSLAWTESLPVGSSALISLMNGEKRRLACTLKPGTSPRVEWNASGAAVLFTIETPTGLDGCVATVDGNTYPLAIAIGETVRRVEWSPFDDTHLLARTDQAGLVVAYERSEKKLVSKTDIPFTIRGSKLYGIRAVKDGVELFNQPIGTLPISFGPDHAALPPGDYDFLASPERYVVLRESKHGRIDVYDTSSLKRLATVIADRILFEPGSKPMRFLAVNGYELTLHDMKEETSRLVIRYSEPITQVAWHPLGGYAILQVGSDLQAVPFEKSSEDAVHLATFSTVQSLWMDAKADTLLILGTQGDKTGVWKLVLKE